MLKLKQLQEEKKKQQTQAQAQAQAQPQPPTDSTATPTATATETATATPTTTPTTTPAAPGLFSLRNPNNQNAGAGNAKRNTAAELRVLKDISEMDTIPGSKLEFTDSNNLLNFTVKIKPNEGYHKGAEFLFIIEVPRDYPYNPPRVRCDTPIYHPNIDEAGAVCLNILRADWKPVLSLDAVIFGLLTLFLEPNPHDPLNKDAANKMITNPSEFERTVKKTLAGGYHMGRNFPKLL